MPVDVIAAHVLSSYHYPEVQRSVWCGCFHCLKLFTPGAIEEWIDRGWTALCPHCGVDAVLPGTTVTMSVEMLREMQSHWFAESACP